MVEKITNEKNETSANNEARKQAQREIAQQKEAARRAQLAAEQVNWSLCDFQLALGHARAHGEERHIHQKGFIKTRIASTYLSTYI